MKTLVLLSIVAIVALRCALAQSVTLAWDRNSEPDVTGYRLHYGSGSGAYSNRVFIFGATTTNTTVTNLSPAPAYFFSLTAVNATGFESDHSPELQVRMARPAPPAGFRVKTVTLK